MALGNYISELPLINGSTAGSGVRYAVPHRISWTNTQDMCQIQEVDLNIRYPGTPHDISWRAAGVPTLARITFHSVIGASGQGVEIVPVEPNGGNPLDSVPADQYTALVIPCEYEDGLGGTHPDNWMIFRALGGLISHSGTVEVWPDWQSAVSFSWSPEFTRNWGRNGVYPLNAAVPVANSILIPENP